MRCFIIPALGILFCLRAVATPVTCGSFTCYVNTGGWAPETGGYTFQTITFNGLTSGADYYPPGGQLILDGVSITGIGASYNELIVRRGAAPFNFGSQESVSGLPGTWGGYLQISFPTGVIAVRANLATASGAGGYGQPLTVSINGGNAFSFNAVNGAVWSFIDIGGTANISSLRIATGADGSLPVLDNLGFYVASTGGDPPAPDTPAANAEEETWVLALTGLVLVAIGARHRRRTAVRATIR